MNAETAIPVESPKPRWRRRMKVALWRSSYIPLIELTVLITFLVALYAAYRIASGQRDEGSLVSPVVVAILLVVNLVPAMTLMVLVARRLVLSRSRRFGFGLKGRLPVRLIAIFSVIASVPTLLVVVFVSLLFQYTAEFWSSDRARTMLENAASLAQENYNREVERVGLEAVAMSGDLARYIDQLDVNNPTFAELFARQVYERNLSEAIIFRIAPDHSVQSLALVNPYDRPLETVIRPETVANLTANEPRMIISDDRFAAVTVLPYGRNNYLYTARVFEPELAIQLRRGAAVLDNYRALINRSRNLQLRFHAALFALSLVIVAIAIFIALRLADRLVRPIGELVGAARKIAAGDLTARVPASSGRDEVATLGSDFNRMTSRLEAQTGALVTANAQLDMRRAFTEAVLSGVTAGVISVDDDHVVRLINSSAEALLKTGGKSPVGQKLADLVPELDRQLTAAEREDVVQVASTGEPRTLAVKTVKVKNGHVLTFDDITEQLMDQRRAAWSDVARRIAHEIKNPLTPIQLAAERLQRRYGNEVTSDQATFERLTGTIVRQVGDLRRMVDEFSSFARMPKPAFAPESLGEIARGALFLHEVAHPDIHFSLDCPDPAPVLVCDRRLLGQALTNVVKNGVEAIQQKQEEKKRRRGGADSVSVRIQEERSRVAIEIIDTGIGLPAERARMTEPYMTTRAKGTGLGLAIVKKIVEEHFGQIEFEDAPGGGSLVRMMFDRETLAHLADNGPSPSEDVSASG